MKLCIGVTNKLERVKFNYKHSNNRKERENATIHFKFLFALDIHTYRDRDNI